MVFIEVFYLNLGSGGSVFLFESWFEWECLFIWVLICMGVSFYLSRDLHGSVFLFESWLRWECLFIWVLVWVGVSFYLSPDLSGSLFIWVLVWVRVNYLSHGYHGSAVSAIQAWGRLGQLATDTTCWTSATSPYERPTKYNKTQTVSQL